MKRLAIVANRSAGQGAAMKQTLAARANLWGRPCDYFFPSSVGELKSICGGIDPERYEGLLVIGGDGTFNQVIRSFRSLPNLVPLYPFPGGTANDLTRELGIYPDWDQVQTLLDLKKTDYLDLIDVNGVPFVTVGGIGIGATLTSDFNCRRQHSSTVRALTHYLHSQIYTLLSAKTILLQRDYIHHLRIRAPSFDECIKTPAVFLCNQTHLGGSLQVAPTIDNNDKRFNVLIVTTCMKARLLNSMAQLRSGKLPSDFLVFSTDSLSIQDLDGRPARAFGDGETLVEANELEFKIKPGQLLAFRDKKIQEGKTELSSSLE